MEQNLYVVEMVNGKIRVIQATEKEIAMIGNEQSYLFLNWDLEDKCCDNKYVKRLVGKVDTTK